MEQDIRTDMVRLAGRIREAGDELHDLAVELADNIARTGPDRNQLEDIITELETSDDSTDVVAHLVACGVLAIMLFDAIDTTTAVH